MSGLNKGDEMSESDIESNMDDEGTSDSGKSDMDEEGGSSDNLPIQETGDPESELVAPTFQSQEYEGFVSGRCS